MPVQSVQTGAEFDLPVMRTTFEEMVEGETMSENCKNCGAPLKDGRCEYCGTQVEPYRRFVDGENCGSFMEITADRIQIGVVCMEHMANRGKEYRKIVVNQS